MAAHRRIETGVPDVRRLDVTQVRLSPAAARSIRREAEASADGRETGGILLGFYSDEVPVITEAGGPGPKAYRSASYFRRDLDYAEQLADAAYRLDGSEWIGDWHTHPLGGGCPSGTDLSGYRSILRADPSLRAFLAVIVVRSDEGWKEPQLSPWLIQAGEESEADLGD
jgi:integrative and conjugative element protein (TIGR02256 family)